VHLLPIPGVFTPHSDTWLLLDAVDRCHPGQGASALDLCTGSGAVAIGLAHRGLLTTAVDLSHRAVAATRINARRNEATVRVVRGHLFDPVEGATFDLITCNPPYVPSGDRPPVGAARAWAAGVDGRRLLPEIARGAARHLRPGGRVLLVHSSLIGEQETIDDLTVAGLRAEVLERRTGPLGPLMRAQQIAGRIDPDLVEEDLVVVSGLRA
jgi:release factor glutamine methyltransferase